jgi:hypothetical protein
MNLNANQVIEALEAEQKQYQWAAVVVAMSTGAEIIYGDGKDRVASLNRMMQSGGRPVGIFGYTLDSCAKSFLPIPEDLAVTHTMLRNHLMDLFDFEECERLMESADSALEQTSEIGQVSLPPASVPKRPD